MSNNTGFINLHMKSIGSFESTISNEDIPKIESTVVSAIDNNMFNVINFYQTCIENNKKPIIGLEVNISFDELDQPVQIYNGKFVGKATLIALDKEGYHNLIRLSNIGYKRGLYAGIPRLDYDMLSLYSNGLAFLIDPIESDMAIFLQSNNMNRVYQIQNRLHQIFYDRLYIESFLYKTLPDFFMTSSIPKIASHTVQFLKPEDIVILRYMLAIKDNKQFSDINIDSTHFWQDVTAFDNWFKCDEISNLFRLIDRIQNYEILTDVQSSMPHILFNEQDMWNLLDHELKVRNIDDEKHRARIAYEMKTISNFGYLDYFVMIYRLLQHVNENLGGYWSAGRGSVGGCLVAYLLGITRVDPLDPLGFDLEIPFDRFLNSGRKTMPDIDLDFLPQDRQTIIKYLEDTYGTNSVKHISTLMRLGARSSLKECCRISGYLTPEIEQIIKAFPSDQQLDLSLVKDSDLYNKNLHVPYFTEMFEIAERLEGLPRSTGIHASGIAISSLNLEESIPMMWSGEKEVTQYDQKQIESLGIIKFDILGLKTLQIVADTMNFLYPNETIREKVHRLDTIDINDTNVLGFICSEQIAGVFQWDTYGYKVVIRRLKPSNFKELVDLNTLGRSASLISGLTDKYIKRKFGHELVEPLHHRLTGLLQSTYGLPLYQEQLMEVFIKLADYSYSEADDVRKAVGKKIPKLLQQQYQKFHDRGLENSLSEDDVMGIWEIIDKFSKYTWNLGHAITYTKICYETAYLAYYHPKEFYSACINNADDVNEVNNYIDALKKRGIPIYNTDINESNVDYKPYKDGVLSGFNGLKFFGEKKLGQFIKLRDEHGIFIDFDDLFKTIPKTVLDKRSVESLLCAGALDSLIEKEDMSPIVKRLGVTIEYLQNLVLQQYSKCGRVAQDLTYTLKTNKITDLSCIDEVMVWGYIAEFKEIFTKTGKKMAFIKFDTYEGRYEITVFDNVLNKIKLKQNILLLMKLEYSKGLVCRDLQYVETEVIQ